MVTYGGMAKQPVMVPVVSTGDAPPLSPVLHCLSPSPLWAPSSPQLQIETLQPYLFIYLFICLIGTFTGQAVSHC